MKKFFIIFWFSCSTKVFALELLILSSAFPTGSFNDFDIHVESESLPTKSATYSFVYSSLDSTKTGKDDVSFKIIAEFDNTRFYNSKIEPITNEPVFDEDGNFISTTIALKLAPIPKIPLKCIAKITSFSKEEIIILKGLANVKTTEVSKEPMPWIFNLFLILIENDKVIGMINFYPENRFGGCLITLQENLPIKEGNIIKGNFNNELPAYYLNSAPFNDFLKNLCFSSILKQQGKYLNENDSLTKGLQPQ